MRKSSLLFAAMAVALLASVGTLLVPPMGPVRGATTLPPGFVQ
jgi:hypothetical protein